MKTDHSSKVHDGARLATGAVLQRKCSCGQHASGGECAECRKKREGVLQRAAAGSEPISELPPIVHEVLRSPGQPLDAATRAYMEPRFGYDFSQVRVHTDARADESARAVDALAYTVGKDVVFLEGQYAPNTSNGRRLLAHELTHTVQQEPALQPSRNLVIAPSNSPYEREADQHAQAIDSNHTADASLAEAPMTADHAVPVSPAQSHSLMRQPAAGVARAAQAALRWLAKRGKNVSAHIAKRHVAFRLGKTRFLAGGKEVKKLLTRTIKDPSQVVEQGRRIVFEKVFDRKIGEGGETIVRVVVDRVTGKIVTAFPTRAMLTVGATAISRAAGAATRADEQIQSRRERIAKALEPSLIESIVDFFMGTERIARSEDIFAEERIIERQVEAAIHDIEEDLQRSLSMEERQEVREVIETEMDLTPTAG